MLDTYPESAERFARALLVQGTAPSRLEESLLHAAVVKRIVPGTLSANPVWQCAMEDGQVAFHKPVEGARRPHPKIAMPAYAWFDQDDACGVAVNEVGAWRLARGMGSPWNTLVATSVLRWLPGRPGIAGDWGAFTRQGVGVSGRLEPLDDIALCDAAALFDCLSGQQDRHVGNYRFDPGTQIVTLFDHGFSFARAGMRSNDSAFLRRRLERGREALTSEERALLTEIATAPCWRELQAVLDASQFASLERRRAKMLALGQVLAVGEFA